VCGLQTAFSIPPLSSIKADVTDSVPLHSCKRIILASRSAPEQQALFDQSLNLFQIKYRLEISACCERGHRRSRVVRVRKMGRPSDLGHWRVVTTLERRTSCRCARVIRSPRSIPSRTIGGTVATSMVMMGCSRVRAFVAPICRIW
jgi:hypothetical protein